MMLFILAALAVMVASMPATFRAWVIAGMIALWAVVFVALRRYGNRPIERALVQADWSRCLYCFFDLRGLGDRGACPECGEQFTLDQTRSAWRVALGKGTVPSSGSQHPPNH